MWLALSPGMIHMGRRSWLQYSGILVLWLLSAARADAAAVTLAWDPSADPDVAGYTIAYGRQPGSYTTFIDAGSTTVFTVDSLSDGTYYFAVRAYSAQGTISTYSNEVVSTISGGSVSTATCSTPDPFISLGGGTCYNGGWLPPGMAPPTGSTAQTPQVVTQPTSTQGCTTPDPFAALGGGTCYNGGWLPPGMPVPSGSTAPAPAPAPAPVTSPSSVQGCSTPDPFAALGGGTCYNGGWLPPGMPVPSGSTAPPQAPAPAPTPAPVTSPSAVQGCSTPDPFAALGGGTCYNGGWFPPGMPIPRGGETTSSAPNPSSGLEAPGTETTACAGPDPFLALGGGTCLKGAWLPPGMEVTGTGTLRIVSLEDGLWVIEDEDGTIYSSLTELPVQQLIDGAIVTFTALTMPSGSAPEGVIVLEILQIEIQQ